MRVQAAVSRGFEPPHHTLVTLLCVCASGRLSDPPSPASKLRIHGTCAFDTESQPHAAPCRTPCRKSFLGRWDR